MESRPTVGSLIARVGLTGQLLGQIFLTPMAAFGLTYLLVFTAEGGDFRLSIEVDMIPWIGMASLFYGMLALALALGMGGFTPLRVIESGGWRRGIRGVLFIASRLVNGTLHPLTDAFPPWSMIGSKQAMHSGPFAVP